MRARPVLVALTTIPMLLSGCSSSFVGHKIGSMPDQQHPIANTGIPLTMNRPEFQLTVVKEKEQLVSTITVKWVPDNSQRYTLSLAPALFTKSSFTHTFDDEGNFAKGAGSVESQAVTTITTLGELATSFVSLGLLDFNHPLDTLGNRIKNSEYPECIADRQKDLFSSYPSIKDEKVKAVIASRWDRYRNDGERLAAGRGQERILDRIHFTSPQERDCFNAIRQDTAETDLDKLATLKDDFDKHLEKFKTEHQGNISFESANGEIEKLRQELDHAKLDERYEELNDPNNPQYDGGKFGDFRLLLLQKAARIAKIESTSFTISVLDAILNMPPEVWRARQALELSERIERTAIKGTQYPRGSVRRDYEEYRKELNAELDHVLGMSDTATQIANLEAYLAAEVPLLAGPHVQRYVVDDRVKVATQLEALRDKYEETRTHVLGMNEPIPKTGGPSQLPKPQPCKCPTVPAPTAELELVNNLVIPTADVGFVEQPGAKLPKNPPPYVLVIEPAKGLPKLGSLTKEDEAPEGARQ